MNEYINNNQPERHATPLNVTAKWKTAGEEDLLDYPQEEEEPARIPVTNNF